ncbi:TniQ family protein [Kitasatospora aureofaciens]|uniref:TniQ family protein n=1 Tax=Kitasatospora aureofaciens TaxID=1894 RepID=UPI0037C999D2
MELLLGPSQANPTKRDVSPKADREGLTDADASTLHRMTLSSVMQADSLPRFSTYQDGMSGIWRHLGRHSRFCPHCLAETGGRWPLAWRVPSTFSCRRHHCLLVDHCPGCRDRPRLFTNSQHGRSTGSTHCMRPVRRDGRWTLCRQDLAETPTQPLPPHGDVLAAQQHLDTLVQSHSSALHDLYFLSRRCLRGLLLSPTTAPAAIARPLAECHGGPPPADHLSTLPDAGRLAVSTTVAVRVSDSASPSGQAVFQWLMQTDRLTRPQADVRISSISRRLQPWQHASPELINRVIADADQELRLDARLRYRSATGPRQPDLTDGEIQKRADKIPHALWPSWTLRLLPNTPTDPRTVDGFRRACSGLLLLPGNQSQHYTWALPDNRTVVHNALRRVIASAGDETPIVSCLTQLADHLDDQGSPIDYRRRRRVFTPETTTLDLDTYAWLCRQQGWARGGADRTDQLRWMLLGFLLGAPADRSPGKNHARDDFRYQIPPVLRSFLMDQAAVNLTLHRIEEPVLWEPPADWCDLTTWPGTTPERIAESGFETLITAGTPVEETAAVLGLTTEHIRLYCDATGITQPPPRASSPGIGRRQPRRGLLDPAFLRTAHSSGTLNQSLIARSVGCSLSTVQNALEEAGVPAPPRPEPLSLHITREKLEHAYLHQRLSIPDIATQFGLDKDRLNLLAKKWGIPIRPNSTTSNPFAMIPNAPVLSEPMAAISNVRNCVERLRRLVQLPGQRNLCSAAGHLGTLPATLTHQLNALERAAGLQLIRRANPLAATAAGAVLIREAEHLLSLLDAVRSPLT